MTERRENDEKSDTESVDQRVDVCVSPSSNVSNNDEIKDSTDKDKTIGTEDIEEVDEPIQIEKVERSLFDEEKENSLHGLTDEIQGTNETAKAISDEMAEKVVYEGEDDDVLESAISEESVNVESVVERPESPKVPDLVKKFQAMDEVNINFKKKLMVPLWNIILPDIFFCPIVIHHLLILPAISVSCHCLNIYCSRINIFFYVVMSN